MSSNNNINTLHYLELPRPNGDTIKVLRTPHPAARRLRLTVTSHGARLTYPVGMQSSQVLAFLRKNAGWLEQKLDQLQIDPLDSQPLTPGIPTAFPFRGEINEVCWQESKFPRIEHDSQQRQLTVSLPHLNSPKALSSIYSLFHSFLQTQIRQNLSSWLACYTPRLGRAPTGVRIKPLKSLWGSLDTRDRMTLDLSLALAPSEVLHYVVVHELCHLQVRNHSSQFWALVTSLYPNWQEQRQWLRMRGHALKAELARLTGKGSGV